VRKPGIAQILLIGTAVILGILGVIDGLHGKLWIGEE
jgi:hypothetical protein